MLFNVSLEEVVVRNVNVLVEADSVEEAKEKAISGELVSRKRNIGTNVKEINVIDVTRKSTSPSQQKNIAEIEKLILSNEIL